MAPIRSFGIFIKDREKNVLGGVTAVVLFGSLYIDSLWMEKTLRKQGLGSQLIQGAEQHGREMGARFATVNTMDFQALPFYQKRGYAIEFTREGYANDSKMYSLTKPL